MPRYKNEVHYDPGRFRQKIRFALNTVEKDEWGNTVKSNDAIIETWAIKEEISSRDQLAINAGLSSLEGSCYFVIRNRKGFVPNKRMDLFLGNGKYTIRGIIPLGQPTTHLRILCEYVDLIP